ncbi:MAG: bacterial Ig-like domain-containing protein [Clostridiales bacterium]|nr:bacterial Ig-like domain-containing protein [Clostridiales bacterium]
MKKTLSVILAVMFIVCACAVSAFAQDYCNNLFVDGKMCNYSGLDFNEKNNIWATKDESGKWVSSGVIGYTFTDGEEEYYVKYDSENELYYVLEGTEFKKYTEDEFYSHDKYSEMWSFPNNAFVDNVKGTETFGKNLDWELSADGEYITLTANSNYEAPGIFFCIDEFMADFPVGKSDDERAEYVSIRLRNYSSASKMTLAFVTSNTNGGLRFMERSTSDAEIIANSGEWVVYTFSMAEINSAMQHSDNKGGSGWVGSLKQFGIFPFGYKITDGTGSYESAKMDIDYIVIGSEEYCKNYKSTIQALEESVTSIKLVSEPTKKSYYVGEDIDLSGLQIEATYSDGTKETISDCSVEYDFTYAQDEAVVTLKYGTSTTPLTYKVKVIGISGIEISSPAKTTVYEASAVADGLTATQIEGVKIDVTYVDGHKLTDVVPSIKNFEISSIDVGDQIVTINYYGSTATYAATVINVASIKVADITTPLHYNDKIDVSKLNITCVYTDGSEKSVSDAGLSDSILDPEFDATNPGEISVTITISNEAYGLNVSGTAKATVLAPDSLKIDTLPAKTTYSPDEQLDTTGLVVKFVYSDGKEVALLDDAYTTRYDFSEPGTTTVTVRSAGLTATFDVVVDGTVSTRPTKKPAAQGGCGSVIGTGALAVIACVTAAGVVICKKKDN